MFYLKNVPIWERLLRLLVGAALVGWGVLGLHGWMSGIAILSSIGLVLSGIFGFCPACAMVGRRLKK